jgi:Major Facilitator Superfamily
VFGIQEGQRYDWGTITGPITVWSLIIAGVVVLAIFVFWQARNPAEPLVPLGLFKDRNFSLANTAIAVVGFGITAMVFPLMLYAQAVRGLSPTKSALLLVPMAVINGALAAYVGRLTDRVHPRYVAGVGMACFPASLVWLRLVMSPDAPIWHLLLPIALLGVANAFMWAPIGSTATRNLPMRAAGAGAGVYNTARQVGSVLGRDRGADGEPTGRRTARSVGEPGRGRRYDEGAATGPPGLRRRDGTVAAAAGRGAADRPGRRALLREAEAPVRTRERASRRGDRATVGQTTWKACSDEGSPA